MTAWGFTELSPARQRGHSFLLPMESVLWSCWRPERRALACDRAFNGQWVLLWPLQAPSKPASPAYASLGPSFCTWKHLRARKPGQLVPRARACEGLRYPKGPQPPGQGVLVRGTPKLVTSSKHTFQEDPSPQPEAGLGQWAVEKTISMEAPWCRADGGCPRGLFRPAELGPAGAGPALQAPSVAGPTRLPPGVSGL